MSEKFAYNSSQLTAHSSPILLFINYANEQYKFQQKFALRAAKKFGGFDKVKGYSPESIDEDFRKAHSEILSIKRGNGLWLWKPYIILKALNDVREGDYVFYCDSGAFFFRSVRPLVESMGNCDVWASDIGFIERQWTKPEVFRQLRITDEAIKGMPQIQGGFVLVRKSEMSCAFICEWLELCTRPDLIMPFEEGEEKGECIAHREDQSLLSLLCKTRGIKPHKSPACLPKYPKKYIKDKIKKLLGIPIFTMWPEAKRVIPVHDDDKYSPCIYLHRIRHADSIGSVVWQVLKGARPEVAAKILMSPNILWKD